MVRLREDMLAPCRGQTAVVCIARSGRWRARSAMAGQSLFEPGEEERLRGQNLCVRLGEREPCAAIDLGDGQLLAGAGRVLHLGRNTDERGWIAVALHCPA